jgi:Protein of unknown function (DUF3592)
MDCSNDSAWLPPPPRQLRRRRGLWQIAGAHFFLVIALMVASLFWQIAIGTVRLLWFSEMVPANVTKVMVTSGDRGPSYDILIDYRFGDADYSEKVNVAPQEAEALKAGDTVPVQVLPEHPDRAQLYRENYPYVFVTVLLCLFALGPTAGVAKMLWDLYVSPWKLRALMRNGEATSGVIMSRKDTSARCPTYTVTYEYRLPSHAEAGQDTTTPVTIKASMKVPKEVSLGAQVGEKVVVLYRPERPGTSVLYRYADYEILSPAIGEGERDRVGTGNWLTRRGLPIALSAGVLVLGVGRMLGWW